MRKSVSILLSLFLGLFLIEAAVSLLDDTLILALGTSVFAELRALLFLVTFASTVATFLAITVTPMVPKRYFLPLVFFSPVAVLAMIPVSIYQFSHAQQAAWVISLGQLLLGLAVLFRIQGGVRFHWPIVPEEQLRDKTFSWLNSSGVTLMTLLLIAATLAYLALCASLAVDHFSTGFLALSADGLAVRARSYQGEGGKIVQLIPMIHVGEAHFYEQISKAAPTNSVTLLEGVSDEKHLLRYKLSYKRMAASLGLAEQQETFTPDGGRVRRADVDIDQFSKSTIEFLNLISRVHAQGITLPTVREWLQKSQSPALVPQLWDDLLKLRNAHLLGEIKAELPRTDHIVVPWGAAHMPGLARDLIASGFHLTQSEEYKVIEFRTVWNGLRRKYPARE